ncbi:FAD-binding oxidoreductase [Alsobacter sp. R-9]
MSASVADRPVLAVGAAIAELTQLFGDRIATSQALRDQHAHTTTWVANQPPDAVVFPASTEHVQAIVRICARHDVPVIPFGAGTSFEGHVNAPFGGICIDTREMNAILTVNPEDFDCVVGPGITRKALNARLRDMGLMFPVDPGADASLGGMASTRASGTTAVRYGTMRDNVLSLVVVLPDGKLLRTASRARKSSAGYDLTRLFVGAEGTLGIITELTLRLHAIPEAIAAATCRFQTVRDCCDAAIAGIQSGVSFARVELLDAMQVKVCNAHSRLDWVEEPTLFVEFHGMPASVAEQADRFRAVALEAGAQAFEWSADAEARSRLWHARHDVFWALKSYRPGAQVIVTDACVPISRLAECVEETQRDIAMSRLIAPIVGHVGDGNFHASILVMMDDADEIDRAKAFVDRLALRAIGMGGTSTGEHGIGQGKRQFLAEEHGDNGVSVMTALKRALDPSGMMNPGKIFF